jgi:hypothetical protein
MVNDNHARRANPVGDTTAVHESGREPATHCAAESDLRDAPTESPDPRPIDALVETCAAQRASRTTFDGIAVFPTGSDTSALRTMACAKSPSELLKESATRVASLAAYAAVLEHGGCVRRPQDFAKRTIAPQVDPAHPLGRRVLIDGVDALDHPGYVAHCRNLLARSVDDRVAYLRTATGDHRHRLPDLEFLLVDFVLNPGWLVELYVAAAYLSRRRRMTEDYRRGRDIVRVLDKARRVYRFGMRGNGAAEK